MSNDGQNNLKQKSIRLLSKLYSLKHENITKFLGIYSNSQFHQLMFVWEFASRGSLAEILENTEIKLEWHFKVSLLGDIVQV
jgi:serine/threonine protein kinase